jgi:hypothetical protein
MWDTTSSMAIRMEHIDDNSHGELSFFWKSKMRWSETTGYPIPSSGLEPNLPIKLAQSNVVLLVNYTPIYIL